MSWSVEDVKKAEDLLMTAESALEPPVTHAELVTVVGALVVLLKKLIADKKSDTELDELAEHMDENGD